MITGASMEQIQHDPKTKMQIKEAIFQYLYGPVQRQLEQRLDTIIISNALLGKFDHKSFTYKGVLYTCDSNRPPLKKNPLVPQLRQVMEDYLHDVRELNEKELPKVLGFINQVLNASNGLTDYLRILPESIHEPVKIMISQCPCHHKELSEEQVQQIQKKNLESIALLKQRMVANLLLA